MFSFFKSNQTGNDKQRVLPFRGVSNFRDHGGYTAADGRQVEWGKLYRSGYLAKMTSSDQNRFSSLGIDTLIDFRSMVEKQKDPNRLPEDHEIRIVSIPMLDGGNSQLVTEVPERVQNNDFDDFDPHEIMLETYRQVPLDFIDQYKQFFRTVMETEGKAVLWHCTAGKDRTGYASAVMLRLLGVNLETVIQDYLLSQKHVDRLRWSLFVLRLMRGKEVVENIKPLMTVNESWIRAAFQTINTEWGDFETYIKEGLDLTTEEITLLRSWYLTE